MMNFFSFARRPYVIFLSFAIFILTLGFIWCNIYNSDPQGDAGLWCDKEEMVSIPNPNGWVISGHNTICTGYGGNSAVYIYVHPVGESSGNKFLVFRYFQYGGEALPKIEWIDGNNISIKIDRVSEITKKLNNLGPIRIHYTIGKEDYPQKNGF
jgi:hypothetical protein